ncbi:MAG: AraC family transcriptional regulator, partial [Acidobacteriota bacterium]
TPSLNCGLTGCLIFGVHSILMQPLPDLVDKLSFFRRLERTWQLIEKEYVDSDLGLERASRISGVSKNHLNVLLRQTTGFTFYQILIRYRLSRAITMMESKNYSILEIVLENGFKSRNSFEKNFRGLIGTTPKKFRDNRDS